MHVKIFERHSHSADLVDFFITLLYYKSQPDQHYDYDYDYDYDVPKS